MTEVQIHYIWNTKGKCDRQTIKNKIKQEIAEFNKTRSIKIKRNLFFFFTLKNKSSETFTFTRR